MGLHHFKPFHPECFNGSFYEEITFIPNLSLLIYTQDISQIYIYLSQIVNPISTHKSLSDICCIRKLVEYMCVVWIQKKRNCLLNLYKRRVVSPISWGIVKYLYLSAPIISPLTFLALLYKKLEIMCISHKVSIGLKTGQKKEKLAIFKSLLLKKHNDMTIYRVMIESDSLLCHL